MARREKPDRAASLVGAGRRDRKDEALDRETEMLRTLVQILAREAARETFERALAEQGGKLDETLR